MSQTLQYDELLAEVRRHVKLLEDELGVAEQLRVDILKSDDPAVLSSLADVELRIEDAKRGLEELCFERLSIKGDVEFVNHYENEGGRNSNFLLRKCS